MNIKIALSITTLNLAASFLHVSADEQYSGSLCLPVDRIYFSCVLENKKTISLCGTGKNGKDLIYRYGTQERIELEYPNTENRKRPAFYRINASGGSAQMDIIKFKIGAYTYNLYDSFFDGIAVWGPRGLELKKTCESGHHSNIAPELLGTIPEIPQQENNFK